MASKPLHICHLSLLNPAIHSRIFFKMATTQVAAGHRVSIIAQDPSPVPYLRDGVQIYPIREFGRLSWRRLWLPRRIGRMAAELEADVYQVHTVELLGVGRKLKQESQRARVIFDMHEDYVANVLFADYYAEWTRARLANRIQGAQYDFARWGDGLILAEDCFQGIIPFDPERTAIVRNKYQAPREVPQPKLHLQELGLPMMLHTGTIAENWGVGRALELWIRLNSYQPLNLVIAGHSQDRKVIAQVHQVVEMAGLRERFCLLGGQDYLPYEDIVALIKACTFGTALYSLKRNIQDRIPTKFYEFMACNKPLVFTQNPAWDALNLTHPFGRSMVWPPEEADYSALLKWIGAPPSSVASRIAPAIPFPPAPPTAWSWESEAPVMLDLIRKLTA
jgi:glycosyltransferase involved in cell wall biosynthesis